MKKSKEYYSLKYLLSHEDYVGLSIHQKINAKVVCFKFDMDYVDTKQAIT